MKNIIMLMAFLSISGCSQLGYVADKGATAADAALETGVYAVCMAPTRGAVLRRWPTEEAQARHTEFCAGEGK